MTRPASPLSQEPARRPGGRQRLPGWLLACWTVNSGQVSAPDSGRALAPSGQEPNLSDGAQRLETICSSHFSTARSGRLRQADRPCRQR